MLLYVGPNQILPLSGFLGTIGGLAAIFWGWLFNIFRRLFNRNSTHEGPGDKDET